jgi:lysophospholipase L1-like esterase
MVKFIATFFIIFFFVSSAFAAINILPLGDSITVNVENKSYRFYLWKMLKSEGYNVDFIGSKRHQNYDDFDPDHEGHSGWRADQIAENLKEWLNNYTPDIVLLHIGHNDFFQGETVDNVINDIKKIIDILQANNPKVVIFLAQIIYPNWKQTKFTDLNTKILSLAENKTNFQSIVIPVNQNEYFDPETDTFDRCHPNDSGDQKIAQQWFNAIIPVLSKISDGKFLMAPKLELISDLK